jgi:hypothetical protein
MHPENGDVATLDKRREDRQSQVGRVHVAFGRAILPAAASA